MNVAENLERVCEQIAELRKVDEPANDCVVWWMDARVMVDDRNGLAFVVLALDDPSFQVLGEAVILALLQRGRSVHRHIVEFFDAGDVVMCRRRRARNLVDDFHNGVLKLFREPDRPRLVAPFRMMRVP